MIKVAGHWELGWNTPIKEIELWEYPLRDFGVDEFYMSPVSGIASPAVKERAGLEEILAENPTLTAVFVDERASTSLSDFKHPEHALYVFGKANFSPLLTMMRLRDVSVKIDTKLNAGLLWPHQAAAIVLHSRRAQWP